jgi:hypothetical protein
MHKSLNHLTTRLRQEAILATLYLVWPRPLGPSLLADSLPEDLSASPHELERDLHYLAERGDLILEGPASLDGPPLHRLSLAGVDAAEAHLPPLQAQPHQMLRLRVLQALDLGRPQPLGERLISLALAEDRDLDLSVPSLRRALRYLQECGLAILKGSDAWAITAPGIDYLSGQGADRPGIARPQGW